MTNLARSNFALATDSFRRTLLWWLVVVVLLLAWVAWFFLAQVSVYENSTDARLQSANSPGFTVLAYFSPQAVLGKLQPGQPAQLHLAGFDNTPYQNLEATLVTIDSINNDGKIPVEFALSLSPSQQNALASILQVGLTGTIEVVVKQASPASLLFESAGVSATALNSASAKATATRASPLGSFGFTTNQPILKLPLTLSRIEEIPPE